MQCPRCGAALAVGAAVCGRCGNPVSPFGAASANTEPSRSQAGLPIARYAPSPYGPPVDGDQQMTLVRLVEVDAETRRAVGYRPVDLPPPPPRRRGGWKRLALVGAVIVAAVAAAVALTHGGARLGLGARPSGATTAPMASTQAAASVAACAVRAVNPTAAKLLAHPQLTTGVRDAAKKDYRPVNNVTTFTSHQAVYLTFEIVTSQSGSVGAVFCAPGIQALGQLAIPPDSSGRYAEFAMIPGETNVGKATATILWNGMVAASLPFTITQ